MGDVMFRYETRTCLKMFQFETFLTNGLTLGALARRLVSRQARLLCRRGLYPIAPKDLHDRHLPGED